MRSRKRSSTEVRSLIRETWSLSSTMMRANTFVFAQERFDKRRTQVENVGRVRDDWQQDRAEHISWIWLALTQPSEIVLNNQVSGNEVYLLGAPRNDHARPIARYYVSVRPIKGGQRLFKTAYPISQTQMGTTPGGAGQGRSIRFIDAQARVIEAQREGPGGSFPRPFALASLCPAAMNLTINPY